LYLYGYLYFPGSVPVLVDDRPYHDVYLSTLREGRQRPKTDTQAGEGGLEA